MRAANSGQSGPWAFGTGTPKSGDATLSMLSGSTSTNASDFGGTLDIGTFGSENTAYAATVENAVTHMKLTPTLSDSDATVKLGKGSSLAAATSGSASGAIALNFGTNEIKVEVTAEDGTTKRTYTVTVTRKAASRRSDERWGHGGQREARPDLDGAVGDGDRLRRALHLRAEDGPGRGG